VLFAGNQAFPPKFLGWLRYFPDSAINLMKQHASRGYARKMTLFNGLEVGIGREQLVPGMSVTAVDPLGE